LPALLDASAVFRPPHQERLPLTTEAEIFEGRHSEVGFPEAIVTEKIKPVPSAKMYVTEVSLQFVRHGFTGDVTAFPFFNGHASVETAFQTLPLQVMAKFIDPSLSLPLFQFLQAAFTSRTEDNLVTEELEAYQHERSSAPFT